MKVPLVFCCFLAQFISVLSQEGKQNMLQLLFNWNFAIKAVVVVDFTATDAFRLLPVGISVTWQSAYTVAIFAY